MAMSVCMKCVKYLVFIFNLIFWIAGMGVLVTAMYIRFDPSVKYMFDATDEELEELFFGSYILMGVGFLMSFVGFLGCCGAYQESQWLLASFFACLIIILGGEITGVVWAYVNIDEIQSRVDEVLSATVRQDYNVSKPKTIAYDWLQENLMCCGATNKNDWHCSAFSKKKNDGNNVVLDAKCDIGISGQMSKLVVPTSCCTKENKELYQDKCGDPEETIGGVTLPAIYEKGCSSKLEAFFRTNLTIVIGTGAGLLAIEVLGMIFAMILCCNLRRVDDDHYIKP